MIRREEVYKIGKIGKPHGVSGEINFMFDDDVFDRTDAEYLVLDIDGILVPFFMEEYRFRSDSTAIVKFCDIDTQEKVRQLTGCEVFFPRAHAGDDDGVVTWSAIVGFAVIDQESGRRVGTIRSVDDSTVNTLFEVSADGGQDMLLPAHEELIADVDMAGQTITMHLPEGLLTCNPVSCFQNTIPQEQYEKTDMHPRLYRFDRYAGPGRDSATQ